MSYKTICFVLLAVVGFWSSCATASTIDLSTDLLCTYDDSRQSLVFRFGSEAPKDSVVDVVVNGEEHRLLLNIEQLAYLPLEVNTKGQLLKIKYASKLSVAHISLGRDHRARLKSIPLYLSLVPPLMAIILALIFKEVIISLFVGILSGVIIAGGMRLLSLKHLIMDVFSVVENYIAKGALYDTGHLSVITFSVLIGGMVAVISKNGGMEGIVKAFAKYANSSKNAQYICYLLGISIFFDDYANTLIVGNTMRPVTDRFRVSREKLAYIVDSTAAPVAALAFITTWIGFELGQIDNGLQALGSSYLGPRTPYAVFFESLRYAYYPILTLIFIYFLIRSGKDYGPMYRIEQSVRDTGKLVESSVMDDDQSVEDLDPVPNAPRKWSHAAVPILLVILVTILGLTYTGMNGIYTDLVGAQVDVTPSWASIWSHMPHIISNHGSGFFLKLGTLLGYADSYVGLLWGSTAGVISAVVITVWNKTMTLNNTMDTLVLGFKTMVPAVVILCLAWGLAIVTEELETAHYLSSALEGKINPYLLPLIMFPLSALIAFSTGSSWSTMAILYPIGIPATWTLCQAAGLSPEITQELLYNVIAIIIGASVLGDHCSPISDTTILSSLATQCNHINHVRTQMPYALTVGVVALMMNQLSTMLGGGWLRNMLLLAVGILLLYIVVKYVGKKIPDFHESTI